MDIRTERLNRLLRDSGKSQKDVCEGTGITKGSLSSYLSGRYFPKQKALDKLAHYFNVSIPYLMGLDDEVYEYAAAGAGAVMNGVKETETEYKKDGYYFVRVKGDSMYPTIHDGDVVVVKNTTAFTDKDICLVKINGDEAMIKRVQKRKDGIVLIGDNVNVYPPTFFSDTDVQNLPIEISGVVVEVRRKI